MNNNDVILYNLKDWRIYVLSTIAATMVAIVCILINVFYIKMINGFTLGTIIIFVPGSAYCSFRYFKWKKRKDERLERFTRNKRWR